MTEKETIVLRVTDSVTFVEGTLRKEIYQEFKKALGYKDDKALWKVGKSTDKDNKKKHQNKNWDGWRTTVCYNKKWCRCAVKKDGTHFPSGLISRAKEFFDLCSIPYTIVDDRVKVTRDSAYQMSADFEPRDYQLDIKNKSIKQQRGIIKLATGGGKCRSADSCVLTDQGMLTFEELGNGIDAETYDNRQAIVASPLTDSRREQATEVYHDGWGPSRRCITKKGFASTATPDHQIKVLTQDGIVWKKTSDLEVGDYAVMAKNQQLFGNSEELSLEDAYWIGMICGDGVWTENSANRNTIKFTNEDSHLLNIWSDFGERHNLKAHIRKHSTSVSAKECTITSKEFCNTKMRKWISPSTALHKTIPLSIRQSTKDRVAMFIRGLYETDGWCCYGKSKPTLCIAFSSKILVDQLHVMLLNFGIVAHRRVKKTAHADSHVLTIYRSHIPQFINEIGFDPSGHKFTKLIDMMQKVQDVAFNTNSDLIPNQATNIKKLRYYVSRMVGYRNVRQDLEQNCDVTYSALRSWSGEGSWRNPSRDALAAYCHYVISCCDKHTEHQYAFDCKGLAEQLMSLCRDDLFYDEIVSIEEDFTDNYDFVVPETHSYIANGFINHNTAIASSIIAELGVAPTIFYVTSKDLLKQAKSELERFIRYKGEPIEVGMIGDGKCDIRNINIMTVQTAVRSLGARYTKFDEEDATEKEKIKAEDKARIRNLIETCQCMICDEVQHWAAKTCQLIADHSLGAKYRYGLSATPWRDEGDDILIDGCFGKPIVDINASFLIRKGILVKPTIAFVHMPHFSVEGSYQTVYKEGIVENIQRNTMIANIAKQMISNKRQTLLLCTQINHGETLEKMIPGSFFINGSHTGKQRDAWIAKMRRREAPVTIATSIFDEGVDVKPLDGLILAGSGKSQTRALQRVGRVIRAFTDPLTGEKKKDAYVIDFKDRMKYMQGHSAKRRSIYETEPEFIIEDYK